MKKLISILLLLTLLVSLISCDKKEDTSDDDYDYEHDYNYNYDYEETITKNEAIQIAKSSTKVLNEIANKVSFKTYYTPTWTNYYADTATGGWYVTLSGKISGYSVYSGDFKTYKFTAQIKVSSSGDIGKISVDWW